MLFTKTLRTNPKGEESINASLLIRAGFIHKEMAGVYTFLPLGLRVIEKIAGIIREEMIALGAQEILMPALHPKENWMKTGRWETFDGLFKFTSFYTRTEYALGGTHEEIVTPLVKNFVFSYRDLPVAVFQIQNKFRDEKRAKSGLLRGKEFVMKDLYSFHRDEKDAEEYYQKVQKAYMKIFERAGIGEKTYLTFASGGTFSQFSHEFQTITPAGEDTIFLCKKCKIAVNKEIIEEHTRCPQCKKSDLKEEKAIEVGNIFNLKTRYSKAFELQYKDEKGKTRDVVMGCYGIGVNRLMGAIVEVWHDKKGIQWPASVAPFQAHLLSFPGGEKEGEKLYLRTQELGLEVLYDDREISPGEKLMDADLIGIPLRVIISENTLKRKSVEVKKRGEEKVRFVKIDSIISLLQS